MGGSACRDSFTRICNLIFPRSLRKGVNVLVWLVAIPHPLREREQSCLSRAAKATNAGVGVTQEHLQSAPLCEGKLFSDTLPLSLRKPSPRSVPLEPGKSHFPSPLEGEGAVVLEPSGESYECGCGVKNNKSTIPPYGLRPLPPQGGQMPALAINKLRIPSPFEYTIAQRPFTPNVPRHSESDNHSGTKNP